MEGSGDSTTRRNDDKDNRHDGENNDGSTNPEERIIKGTMNQCEKMKEKINNFRKHRKTKHERVRNFIVIKRSNKAVQALTLPKVLNLNPRSAMNKIDELKTFIEEESIDCAFISESHEKENKKLEDQFKLEGHVVISNIYQDTVKVEDLLSL